VRRYRPEWPPASFLAKLGPSVLLDFLDAGEVVRFKKGQVLVREGDSADEVFLLLAACVKATVWLGEDRQALLAVRVGGDIVGEIAVMDGGVRTATVSACGHESVIAVRVGRDAVFALLERDPDAAVSLAAAVSRKMRVATRRRVDSVGCSPKVRLARVILEMAEDYGQPFRSGTLIGVNLTKFELGTLVGISERTADRALCELLEDKLIGKVGRRVYVSDMGLMRSAVQPR
jgi:CRP/FNR family cyclic AMP-dependent transcriptional regulator